MQAIYSVVTMSLCVIELNNLKIQRLQKEADTFYK